MSNNGRSTETLGIGGAVTGLTGVTGISRPNQPTADVENPETVNQDARQQVAAATEIKMAMLASHPEEPFPERRTQIVADAWTERTVTSGGANCSCPRRMPARQQR